LLAGSENSLAVCTSVFVVERLAVFIGVLVWILASLVARSEVAVT
jgi:hypothetical protein